VVAAVGHQQIAVRREREVRRSEEGGGLRGPAIAAVVGESFPGEHLDRSRGSADPIDPVGRRIGDQEVPRRVDGEPRRVDDGAGIVPGVPSHHGQPAGGIDPEDVRAIARCHIDVACRVRRQRLRVSQIGLGGRDPVRPSPHEGGDDGSGRGGCCNPGPHQVPLGGQRNDRNVFPSRDPIGIGGFEPQARRLPFLLPSQQGIARDGHVVEEAFGVSRLGRDRPERRPFRPRVGQRQRGAGREPFPLVEDLAGDPDDHLVPPVLQLAHVDVPLQFGRGRRGPGLEKGNGEGDRRCGSGQSHGALPISADHTPEQASRREDQQGALTARTPLPIMTALFQEPST
jgi:hypothetical protein